MITPQKKLAAVEYIADAELVALSGPIILPVDAELALTLKGEDGAKLLDFVDQPEEQIRRYGRVIVKRAGV